MFVHDRASLPDARQFDVPSQSLFLLNPSCAPKIVGNEAEQEDKKYHQGCWHPRGGRCRLCRWGCCRLLRWRTSRGGHNVPELVKLPKRYAVPYRAILRWCLWSVHFETLQAKAIPFNLVTGGAAERRVLLQILACVRVIPGWSNTLPLN